MASDEFGHTAKQETLDAAPPMRTNDDQIGTPLCSGIDDSLSDVTYLDGGIHLESCAYAARSQFARPTHGLVSSGRPTQERSLEPFAGVQVHSAATHATPEPPYAQAGTA